MTVDRRECVSPQWASPLQANPPQINLLLSNLLQIKKASLCLCLLLPAMASATFASEQSLEGVIEDHWQWVLQQYP